MKGFALLLIGGVAVYALVKHADKAAANPARELPAGVVAQYPFTLQPLVGYDPSYTPQTAWQVWASQPSNPQSTYGGGYSPAYGPVVAFYGNGGAVDSMRIV